MMNIFKHALFAAMSSVALAGAVDAKTITDQLGVEVDLPDAVNRVVVLQHQTLNILVQLNASDKVVGLQQSWKKQLGEGFSRLAPNFEKLPAPGDLTSVNIEALAGLKPDVVFIANYAPKDMRAKIESLGIPVVAISLRKAGKGAASDLNPELENEEYSYNEGLKDGIRLIGDVVGRSKEAEELISYTFKARELAASVVEGISDDKRVRAYMANPNLTTYGSGKYTGLMMKHAGALNVAASEIKGYKQVSMEKIMGWDPEVIFVQDRYPSEVGKILNDPLWSGIKAVKDGRVHLMPEYAKAWGFPMPEALAVGELWMACKLYPDRCKNINVEQKADEFYTRFYRTRWIDQSK